jgi:hypothetical protein
MDGHVPQPGDDLAQIVVSLGVDEVVIDRSQAEIDAGFRRELVRRDGERVERRRDDPCGRPEPGQADVAAERDQVTAAQTSSARRR